MRSTWKKAGKPYEYSRISYIDSYLYNFRDILRALNRAIHTDIDIARFTREQKVNGLFEFSRRKHIPSLRGKFFLLTYYNYALSVFYKDQNRRDKFFLVPNRTEKIFVPNYYHDRKDSNFLQFFNYVGEKSKIDDPSFSQYPEVFGRKLYIYEPKKDLLLRILDYSNLDFFFPKKHFYNVGWTVEDYSFNLENAPTQIKNILKPTNGLINIKNGTKHIDPPTKEIFEFNAEIEIKKLIKKYKELPTKKFINESHFLYDKSNLIKKTFTSAIQKQLSLYGSFSYFSGDTTTEILNLIEPSNFLKFFIEKKKS